LWLATADDDFVSDRFARERLPEGCGSFRVERLPPVGHPERDLVACDHLRRTEMPARAYLAGDGAVISAMTHALVASGLSEEQVAVECFFNNPAKRAA
jgi:hypothetical protein